MGKKVEWWRQEGWAKGHSFTPVGVTSAFPSAHNTTASGRGPGPGVLPPAGPRRVFLGTLALFQMICERSGPLFLLHSSFNGNSRRLLILFDALVGRPFSLGQPLAPSQPLAPGQLTSLLILLGRPASHCTLPAMSLGRPAGSLCSHSTHGIVVSTPT